MNKETILQLDKVSKLYAGAEKIDVLQGFSASLKQGEMVALLGPSGSGKSTLLNLVGLLDAPSEGSILLNSKETAKMNDTERTHLRREMLGFVFQFHHLLAEFTALENVILPLRLQGFSKQEASTRGSQLLSDLGLKHRLTHFPSNLSGGEQQRVAIARALVHRPKLILADEPTGNLDPETAKTVLNIFIEAVKKEGATLLMVTHDHSLAARMDRTITL